MIRDKATGRVLGRVPRVLEIPDHPDSRHDVLLRLLHPADPGQADLAQDPDPATPWQKTIETFVNKRSIKEHLYAMKLFV